MTALVYRTAGAWGAGKGSNLTPAEIDGDIYELALRIAAIIADIPEPLQITNVTLNGTQLRFYLEDGTVFGPLTVPQANFRPSIVGTLDAPTDGVYAVTNADSNRYWRYDDASDLEVDLPVTALTDMEVTFRQVGAGALLFPNSTDVTVNGLDGFLNQTGGAGSVVTAKFVATGEWDLIGRVAEDVTA